ncbi:MAG: M14 family metallopeptidase [Acidobacteria bacterium]|nr:M14 family metallopeptidase [Acidobacteriota bacterium]
MHPYSLRLLSLRLLTSAALILLLGHGPASAQTRPRPPQPRGEPAGPARLPPTPSSLLGFAPGDDRKVAGWRQITDYFARLDEASPRVLVQTIGQTTLKRPLVVAFISAPENIRNLAKYQEIGRRLADPRLVASAAERDRLVAEGKTVVAVSCSIHSTEIVASQMSMQLAYDLAAAEDEETREILQNTILLLLPSANPDGVDIVADWYKKTLGGPYEGTEPPELYHHYAGHDNNRDWFMLNLVESQHITRLFWKEWFPQVVYDVHQMGAGGARFFIPPFYDPPNPHIDPLLLREVGLVGHRVAADLQAAGQQGVITNAQYDTWWHGGFRTAPYFHNSIGILSEAASARLMTPTNVSRDTLARATSRGMPSALQSATNFPDPWPGGQWRPKDIMRMELIASRAVLSMAAKHRARYLRNFYDLGRRALDAAREKDAPLGYVIPPGQGRDESVAKLVSTLIAQGVEVHRLERELHGVTAEQRLVKATVREEPRPRAGDEGAARRARSPASTRLTTAARTRYRRAATSSRSRKSTPRTSARSSSRRSTPTGARRAARPSGPTTWPAGLCRCRWASRRNCCGACASRRPNGARPCSRAAKRCGAISACPSSTLRGRARGSLPPKAPSGGASASRSTKAGRVRWTRAGRVSSSTPSTSLTSLCATAKCAAGICARAST